MFESAILVANEASLKECWINVYPHGLGAFRFQSSVEARTAALCCAIYRIHVKLK